MHFMRIICAVLFAVISITATNASLCRPVTCMLACPYGFATDANGCPHCSCRVTPSVCIEPITGYNCGTIDHRDCPSSHECQLTFSSLHGRCCLKNSLSTTGRPATGTHTAATSTSRPATGTTTARPGTGITTTFKTTIAPQTSTRRTSPMLLALSLGSATTNRETTGFASGSPVSTTQRPATTTGRATGSPVSTTQRPVTTTGRATGSPGTTSHRL